MPLCAVRPGFACLVTVKVYVLVVDLSPDVATTFMVFGPTASGIAPDAVPEVTEVPFTLTVAVAVATVGVTVIEETALATAALYV
jgi:hypothetical protein